LTVRFEQFSAAEPRVLSCSQLPAATLWPGGPEYFNQTDDIAGNYFAANTLAYIADA
jgi:hypothetical protein